ncbi:thioredoxin-like 3-3 isoform X2 [Hevea brasiliensis]|uniref:thioredoxin-like 3-3 isoform X2 n=1 Tax=Hevea brasiliensis TaxID=3981 RepID=UPI0025EA3BCD|nr:thioredoxin-like 3-3 isoform X2 [Hevea brasiliensis]
MVPHAWRGLPIWFNTRRDLRIAILNVYNLPHRLLSPSPKLLTGTLGRCGVCSQILPAFCQLSNNFPKQSFIYADIDECPETTQHIRYTPTFHFYRDGERVDEMFGAGEERLHDRLWLHS